MVSQGTYNLSVLWSLHSWVPCQNASLKMQFALYHCGILPEKVGYEVPKLCVQTGTMAGFLIQGFSVFRINFVPHPAAM